MLTIEVVSNSFPDIAQQLPGAVSQAVRETAFQVEADAKSLVPVDTGFLRSSIQTSIEDEFSAVVNVSATYAAYVEFGTSRPNSRAQPYLVPAVEMNKSRLMQALGMLERAL